MSVLKINNWAVVHTDPNPYLAPEWRRPCLNGFVENHPRLGSDIITTSYIVGITDEGFIKTASGSVYELGLVRNDYESHCPNAKDRLVESLRKQS